MKRGIMVRRLLDCAMLLVAFLGIAALPAFGQIDRGAITGKVVDASGAIVPGATVTVTNKATGVVVSTPVDSAGEYQVLTLIPGKYAVRASANGFETDLR